MPFAAAVPLAIAGISALSGLLGGRKKTQEQNSTTNYNVLDSPEYDPLAQGYRDQLINQYTRLARYNAGDTVDSYLTGGAQNINAGANALRRRTQSNFAARGLNFSPGYDGGVDNDRVSQLIQLYNQAPLMKQQMEAQNLQQAGQFFSTIPHAQRRTGSTNTTGTVTSPNTMAADAFGAGAVTLAGLYGKGAFGGGGQAAGAPMPTPGGTPYTAPAPQMQGNPWAYYGGAPTLQLPGRRY